MCHCNDCRKITASVITTAFIVRDSHLEHLRGQDNLTVYTQSDTIASGNDMSNFFCKTCGTLMYRRGICAPDCSLLRTGTVDDFTLHETVLKPTVENFAENRVCWLKELEGAKQFIGQAPLRSGESGLVSVSEVGKFCVLISELPQKHARKRLSHQSCNITIVCNKRISVCSIQCGHPLNYTWESPLRAENPEMHAAREVVPTG